MENIFDGSFQMTSHISSPNSSVVNVLVPTQQSWFPAITALIGVLLGFFLNRLGQMFDMRKKKINLLKRLSDELETFGAEIAHIKNLKGEGYVPNFLFPVIDSIVKDHIIDMPDLMTPQTYYVKTYTEGFTKRLLAYNNAMLSAARSVSAVTVSPPPELADKVRKQFNIEKDIEQMSILASGALTDVWIERHRLAWFGLYSLFHLVKFRILRKFKPTTTV